MILRKEDLTEFKIAQIFVIFFGIWIYCIMPTYFSKTTTFPNSNISYRNEFVLSSGKTRVAGQTKLHLEKNKLYELSINTDYARGSSKYFLYVNNNGNIVKKSNISDFKSSIKQSRDDKFKRDVLVPVVYIYDKNNEVESIQLKETLATRLVQALGYNGYETIILVLALVILASFYVLTL